MINIYWLVVSADGRWCCKEDCNVWCTLQSVVSLDLIRRVVAYFIFSTVGNILTDRRARLSPENAQKLLIIKANLLKY